MYCERLPYWGYNETDINNVLLVEDRNSETWRPKVVPTEKLSWFFTPRHYEVVLKGILKRSALHEMDLGPFQRNNTGLGEFLRRLEFLLCLISTEVAKIASLCEA